MAEAVGREIGEAPEVYVSRVAPQGARIVSACAS
jgi:hypothetical protein